MSRDTTSQDKQGQPEAQRGTGNTAQGSTERERNISVGREETRGGRGEGLARREGTLGTSRPIAVMQRLSEDMDRLFYQLGFPRAAFRLGSFFDRDLWRDRLRTLRADQALWEPQMEVFRRNGNLVMRADLPGVKKDDVQIDVEDDMLTISGERYDEHEDRRDDYYRTERSYGQFFRAIPLPEGVRPENVKASFNDGVLEITTPLPKQEEQKQSRRVEIR